jgi:hypothetical protein
MLIQYLLLIAAVVLLVVGVTGRRSRLAIAIESLVFATFALCWSAGMSLLPTRPPVGIVFPFLAAIGCAVVAVVIELNTSAGPAPLDSAVGGGVRGAQRIEAGTRLTVTGFFWLALFGLMVLAFAPYALS